MYKPLNKNGVCFSRLLHIFAYFIYLLKYIEANNVDPDQTLP